MAQETFGNRNLLPSTSNDILDQRVLAGPSERSLINVLCGVLASGVALNPEDQYVSALGQLLLQ